MERVPSRHWESDVQIQKDPPLQVPPRLNETLIRCMGMELRNPQSRNPGRMVFRAGFPTLYKFGNDMIESPTHLTFNFCDHKDTQPVIVWLSGAYSDLQVQAQALVDDYWRRMKELQKGRKGSDRSSLGLRLRARENGAFSLEWYRTGPYRLSGRDISAEYIRRGQSLSYCRQALLRGQPSWVEPLVDDFEPALAEFRLRIAMVGKIRFAVVQYEKKLAEHLLKGSPKTGAKPRSLRAKSKS